MPFGVGYPLPIGLFKSLRVVRGRFVFPNTAALAGAATYAEAIMQRKPDEQLAAADEFATILPAILTYLTSVFRFVRCQQTRDDMLAEGVGLCWKWFVRAKGQGKNPTEFPTALARFAARAVRAGRTVCGSHRSKEVLSAVARHRHGVAVEYLGHGSSCCPKCHSTPGSVCCDPYEEYLCENSVTPVPEQVAFRIDWPLFVDSLSERDRELMYFLGLGNSNQDVATEFGLSPGRVSQLRKGWAEEWRSR